MGQSMRSMPLLEPSQGNSKVMSSTKKTNIAKFRVKIMTITVKLLHNEFLKKL